MSTLRFIPLDASESAVLRDNQSLLPLPVYQQLAVFITEALKKVPDSGISPDINTVRSHNAVSVDGARGTGKTSVLVNLRQYLENDDEHRKLLRDIHIFSPIDPTLLEENESLFLHIIVAALLSDKAVQDAQRAFPDKRQQLDKSLEALANALTSVEKQNSEYGMAKLRSLFGNQRLAGCVQDFFKATLDLLDKKLLVLPIDDVDTSLNRAFENLEIIRRYLTTPYVLPIVSGDRNLYREVTWRDFHGRITRDSKYKTDEAYIQAVELADEYQRKLLPLPRRLEMPDVSEYLKSGDIELRDNDKKCTTLNNFYSWLQIFIAGPVNGLEGSNLTIPVPSIRALSQLINKCGSLIPQLPSAFRHAESALQVQRAWQMPEVSNEAIEAFQQQYWRQAGTADRDYRIAYKVFVDAKDNYPASGDTRLDDTLLMKWEQTLHDYFRYEPKAGAVSLVLQASQHWQSFRHVEPQENRNSVFDTPLFQPLRHRESEFSQFGKSADLMEWSERLQNKLPESWLTRLHSCDTILPYPVPEVGINSSSGWRYWNSIPADVRDSEAGKKIIFLTSFSMHHNYYTAAKQSALFNIGRIFEVIIASLIGEVSLEHLQRIAQSSPFFSASALAPSKMLNSDSDTSEEQDKNNTIINRAPSTNEMLRQLHEEIEVWRSSHELHLVRFSPWMVYKVFNKVYSQFASSELYPSGLRDLNRVIENAGRVFYGTWSAFGSFEKGRLFGLPEIVSTVNLLSPYHFERSNDHFNTNLRPFVVKLDANAPKKEIYGKSTRTASYYLADHPLKKWIEEALAVLSPPEKTAAKTDVETAANPPMYAGPWLRQSLPFEKGEKVEEASLKKYLDRLSDKKSELFFAEMETLYPRDKWTRVVRRLIDEKKAAK
ncbi:antiviral RADAR system adenosine triphosphatase RdrA [Erwinia sp. Eh17-17]|uniref:antiviral RADAR system adenosine triphosphatase RdrA n=1 Tax=Erwinia sp. Eh17-17 TaxID=3080330 RepID=UPI003209EAA9